MAAYAAFAHGATSGWPQALSIVAIEGLALAVACVALTSGRLWPRSDRLGRAGAVLLVAFAAWSALTLAWSILPDRSWEAFNRAVAYALTVALALVAGSADPGAVRRVAVGWLAIATAIALYALGGKVAPGVNVPGLFDLDHTGDVSRLRAPLEYWNALGLVCVLALPAALALAASGERRRQRLAALAVAHLLLVVLAMTLSRGGLLSLSVAIAVLVALGPARLRLLAVVALTFATAILPVGFAFADPALNGNDVPLGARIVAGRELLAFVVAGFALQLAGGLALLRAERRVAWSPQRSRAVWRTLASGAAVMALLMTVSMAASAGGVRGTADAVADSFTEPRLDRQFDPVRLMSSSSGNRWVWWQEAAGAWSDRPLGGWGAGSFPLVHRQYRSNELTVAQPHSVPLQLLAETGLVGALLALGGFVALLAAGVRRAAGMPWGPERSLAAALAAAGTAWLVHGAVDWDLDIPGVMFPALLMLGVLAARPGPGRPRRVLRPAPLAVEDRGPSGAAVAAGVAAATLIAAALALSALLPTIAERVNDGAAERAGDARSDDDRRRAAARARLAAGLDPLAVRPLLVAASIAEGRGRLVEARRLLLEAVERQPDNPDVWGRVAVMALQLADTEGFAAATRRLLELDPAAGAARTLANRAVVLLTPPSASATAAGTPLPLLLPGSAPAAMPVAPLPPAPSPPPAAVPPPGTG